MLKQQTSKNKTRRRTYPRPLIPCSYGNSKYRTGRK